MIEAVTIDFWNTLVDTANGAARRAHRMQALRAVFDAHGRPWDEDAVHAASRTAFKRFEALWFGEQRTMTADESVRIVWEALGLHPDADQHAAVVTAYEESILIGMPELMPGAFDVLDALSRRYRLAVISDTAISPGHMLRRVLEARGVGKFFQALVFSDETGVSKPHRRAFERALNALGTGPDEAVHVGDIERTDIEGAVAIGMRAIRFEGDRAAEEYNGPDGDTRAQARVRAWSEIPAILASWDAGHAHPTREEGALR